MKYWIGVVSREHARRGKNLGIVQIGHGKHTGLARLHAGDWFIYYAPYETLADKEPVQAFSTLARLTDEDIYQADEGDFKPWRRRAEYVKAHDAPIRPLLEQLSFTAGRTNWGYAFRFGLVEITPADFELIATAMDADIAPSANSKIPS